MNTEQVREEVRSWLAAHWDPNLDLIEWRELLTDSGWGAPDWPSDYFGRDLAPQLSSVVDEELARIGAIGAAHSGVRMLAAVTLLAHGNHEQKQNYCDPFLPANMLGVSYLASLAVVPIWPVLQPVPIWTATNGLLTDKRSGIPARTMPTTDCCWHAAIGMNLNIRV